MTTDPYTPDRGTVRYRYVDGEDPIWEERVAGKWEVER